MSDADDVATNSAGDDEITTEVDPAWIATLRDGGADRASEIDVDDDANWRDAEPAWDPEATVGATDGLIERIRREIHAPQSPIPPPNAQPIAPPPTSRPAPPTNPPPLPATSAIPPAQPNPVAAPVEMPGAPAAEFGVDDAISTTVRWEPRQRLTTAAPVHDNPVFAPASTPGVDRTRIAIAIIAAIALVVVVWLIVGPRRADAPAPVDSVPTSADVSSPTASTIVDQPPGNDAGG